MPEFILKKCCFIAYFGPKSPCLHLNHPFLTPNHLFVPQTPLSDPKMNRATAPKMIGLIGLVPKMIGLVALVPNFTIGLVGLVHFQNDRVIRVRHRVSWVSTKK